MKHRQDSYILTQLAQINNGVPFGLIFVEFTMNA
jgi:hypothetical protein